MYEDSQSEKIYRRFPKVPIERRIGAFAIDFVTIWFISIFFGKAGWLVFLLCWAAMRIFLVANNQGQSLGRYALDMKVIHYRFNRVPDLITLGKREGMTGFFAMLASFGLTINFNNGIVMLLLASPILVDCISAMFDEDLDRAFHDRLAETIVIQTARGYSLDIRLKKLLVTIRRNMQK